ncbi:MAG TPA: glycosyltransferase family 2 protein [Verrucomicrobiae bacterium]|nr:glycosyltransferase family 2 protein [Verrucomicrobiae bacterium]
MIATPPRVSVGLPVYNGERYLDEALKSLLCQTFRDFEIIISDNASTDRTGEIGREYAARDSRVRYYCNTHNLGAAPNFNRTVDLARGEYFHWASYDDLWLPECLERCVEVLDRDPSVVLCHTLVRIIDENGVAIKDFKHHVVKPSAGPPPSAGAPDPEERFNRMIYERGCYPIFGLMRLRALRKTRLHEAYAHGDGVLLARLALLGRYHEIPEYLFLNRDHPARSARVAQPQYHTYAGWFDTKKIGRISLPYWRMLFGYLQGVWETPLSLKSRLWCNFHLLNWMRWTRKNLLKDLKRAARHWISFGGQHIIEAGTFSSNPRSRPAARHA